MQVERSEPCGTANTKTLAHRCVCNVFVGKQGGKSGWRRMSGGEKDTVSQNARGMGRSARALFFIYDDTYMVQKNVMS